MKRTLRRNLSIYIREQSSIYLFTIILFLMGIIFGAIVVNSLSFDQKEDLYLYLSRFFGQLSNDVIADPNFMFRQSFVHYLKYIGSIWVLGLSIIGLPVILVLLFLKGLVTGFTVGFLVNQLGLSGFLLSIVSILPQNIILVPVFIITTSAAIHFSLKMIRQQFLNRTYEPILPHLSRYTLIVIGAFVLIAGVSLLEAYASPFLMKTVIKLISTPL
ncbi:stage II sporulation protein M [Bacillus solimangrovi]|uniref:Stage II sporulation protein M n=1 Tax=Bacillus solimangrovi TaxID=1305675 RepID=A0A1E5LHP3_9BACI|nr:stage II sporulation protein M [Bacillus solimangrovi]OEH93600.1 stage II sporulation protein M [Bacillus solimangrovi]